MNTEYILHSELGTLISITYTLNTRNKKRLIRNDFKTSKSFERNKKQDYVVCFKMIRNAIKSIKKRQTSHFLWHKKLHTENLDVQLHTSFPICFRLKGWLVWLYMYLVYLIGWCLQCNPTKLTRLKTLIWRWYIISTKTFLIY